MSWCSNVIQMRFNKSQVCVKLFLKYILKNIPETINITIIAFFSSRILNSCKRIFTWIIQQSKYIFDIVWKYALMSFRNSPQKQYPKKVFIPFFLLLFFKVFITCIYSQFNVSVYSDSVLYYAMSITRDDDHFVLYVPQKVFGRWFVWPCVAVEYKISM